MRHDPFDPSDGRFEYGYDAENRPNWIQTSSAAGAAGVPVEADNFMYDYLGRRVLKARYSWTGSTWVQTAQERYLYNGWNLIAVGDASFNIVKNCYWGLDLSGTGQGAGGVGGLLMVQESGNSYLPMYDGLGNLHGMIQASNGDIVAAYEYDAFGNTLRESGPYAASNPFRYSTKYTDTQTGLVYYGMRYYSPSLGRFINKDPIEERGGLNLYGFCRNNGVNGFDMLGNYEITWSNDTNSYFTGSPDSSWTMNSNAASGWSTYFTDANGHIYTPQPVSNRLGLDDVQDGGGSLFDEAFAEFGVNNAGANHFAAIDATNALFALADQVKQDTYSPGGNLFKDIANFFASVTGNAPNNGSASSGSGLGNALRNIPLIGRVLGGAGDIVSGVVGTAAGVVTLGHSGTLGSGLNNIGNGLGGVAMGGLDLVGKAWNSPNTVAGLVFGAVGFTVGLVQGTDPGISIGNNAIRFTNVPSSLMPSAMTLGNVIVFGEGEGNRPRDIRIGERVPIGQQEQQHTYQGQVLGPLYFPAHVIGGVAATISSIGSGQPFDVRWHGSQNVLETGPHDQSNPRPWP